MSFKHVRLCFWATASPLKQQLPLPLLLLVIKLYVLCWPVAYIEYFLIDSSQKASEIGDSIGPILWMKILKFREVNLPKGRNRI